MTRLRITIEGPQGSGKSTVAKYLRDLANQDYSPTVADILGVVRALHDATIYENTQDLVLIRTTDLRRLALPDKPSNAVPAVLIGDNLQGDS